MDIGKGAVTRSAGLMKAMLLKWVITAAIVVLATAGLVLADDQTPPLAIVGPPTVMAGATVLPASATAAATNVPFSQTFAVTGGMAPYVWSLAEGELPDGLALNTSTGEVSGTPTAKGLFPITLQVTDSLGAQTTQKWTLSLSVGLRSGWPRELQQRPGTGNLPESHSPTLADLNGDGKDDVIVSDLNTLYVISSDGTTQKVVLPGTVTSPAVADLDGDGQKEIIVSVANSTTSNTIYAFHADLTLVAGFPTGAYPQGLSGYVSSPVVDDFDYSGQMKIAVVASPADSSDPMYGNSVVMMVDSHGQMLPGWPQIIGQHLQSDAAPAVGDLFHDGRKELVTTTLDGLVTVWMPDGGMVVSWIFSRDADGVYTPIDAAFPPTLVDMNGDSYLDVVVKYHSTAGDNVVTVLDGSTYGNVMWTWPRVVDHGATTSGVTVADIEHSGLPYIIAPTLDGIMVYRAFGQPINFGGFVYLGDVYGNVNSNCHAAVADLDGDGKSEIVIGTTDADHNSRLVAIDYLGHVVMYYPPGVPAGLPINVSAGSEVRSTPAIGDLDGNGKLDVVMRSEDGFLWAWEMMLPGSVSKSDSPVFRRNPQHTAGGTANWLSFSDSSPIFNTAAGTSERHRFSVTNWSDHSAPFFFDFGASDPSAFSLDLGTCGPSPFTLEPFGTCSAYVTFSPSSGPFIVGRINILSADLQTATPFWPIELEGYVMQPTYQLNYTKAGDGNGTVTSSTGTSYSTSGSEAVAYGSTVLLSATPAAGSIFTGWSGRCSGTGDCSVYVNTDADVAATFASSSYPIAATAGSNGAIAGPASVAYGASATYTVTAATGYHVADVLVDGVSVGPVTSYSFNNVTANHTIAASFAINSYNIRLAAGPNGSISGPATVTYGTRAEYSIIPATGYHIAELVADGMSFGAATTFVFGDVQSDHTLSATFAINTYNLTATAGANGSISGPATATYGTNATFTIVPAAGYHVADVVVDGASVGAVTSYSFSNVTANHTISASFAVDAYTITATAGANGTISGPATVVSGAGATYAITPATGYHVADVLVDGVSVGAVTAYSFSNVTANHTISASFAINSYSITASAGANGSISGPASVTYAASASYTITPAAGYHVADVLVDGVSVGAVTSYSFSNVTASHTISATFAINSYSMTVTADANGSISGPATVLYGATAVYTITPAANYHITGVVVDGASVGAVSSFSFFNVAGNHTISATFALDSYSISIGGSNNGSISGPATVTYGGSATYTIIPATGYYILDTIVDGQSVGPVSSYTLTNVTANHYIGASFYPYSYNISSSSTAGGSITWYSKVNYGTSATFDITPWSGYHVADVVVDGVSVGAVTSYTFTNVTADHSIHAIFAINSYSITAAAGANGSISGPASANYGTTAAYTITPAIGYHVADVLIDGVSVGAVTSYSFTNVTANHTISASFTINSYSINATAGANGSISGPASATYGASASYTITPAAAYHVADVVVDGVSVGAVTSYSFSNVTANHTISASFAVNSYSISATAGANGTISGPASVNYGGNASYSITPAGGYHVADVVVDGVSVGAVGSYSFSNVTASHTISATFAVNSYSISASAGANGSISGPATATYGASAAYTITPAAGYGIANVVVDGASVGAVSSYTFSNVTANHTISATFAALPDLTATSVTAPTSGTRGRTISVSAGVSNQGGGNAGSFKVAFYLSLDGAVTSSDVFLGTQTVSSLNAGGATTVSASFTVPAGMATGKYYVGAIVDSDSVISESNENNNTRAAATSTTIK
jgi:hypothetical protein